MTIDSLFEDLEAQAYFHSRIDQPVETKYTKTVVVQRPNAKTNLVLNSPLLGKDFIAGFSNSSQPIWLLLPVHAFNEIDFLDDGFSISQIDLTIAELIAGKLLSIECNLELTFGEKPNVSIISMRGTVLEALVQGRIIFISLNAINALTVENLSALESN